MFFYHEKIIQSHTPGDQYQKWGDFCTGKQKIRRTSKTLSLTSQRLTTRREKSPNAKPSNPSAKHFCTARSKAAAQNPRLRIKKMMPPEALNKPSP